MSHVISSGYSTKRNEQIIGHHVYGRLDRDRAVDVQHIAVNRVTGHEKVFCPTFEMVFSYVATHDRESATQQMPRACDLRIMQFKRLLIQTQDADIAPSLELGLPSPVYARWFDVHLSHVADLSFAA